VTGIVAASPATSTPTVAAVELQGVHRSYGSVHAVDGIDLRLELGEIAALLGPNGAGKTTTIDMILGLGVPDVGTVSVLGMHVVGWTAVFAVLAALLFRRDTRRT
jgi:ABC-2 type transport system ATP-binding protein